MQAKVRRKKGGAAVTAAHVLSYTGSLTHRMLETDMRSA